MLDALRSGNHNLATGTNSSAAARKWQRMTAEESQREIPEPSKSVINWLLDSDPAIRWQVMRDLLDEPHAVVAGERSRVALEGWGSRLLGLQGSDGQWGGGSYVFPGWISTTDTLLLLRDLGLNPASEQARKAIGLVRDNCTWGPEFGDTPFFEGEVEPCINGRVLAVVAYFGEASDRLVDRPLRDQLEDGGWNCEAPSSKRSSFHTTICVLEGLLEYVNARGSSACVTAAHLRGPDYLLERRMFRSLATGHVIDPDWTKFSFPTRWHHDVLWGLDNLRRAGFEPGERVGEAIDMVGKKQDGDRRWPLENPHAGEVHFDMEVGAQCPSRWNTLRALRVLDWFRCASSN
jgi:hypothetical protein